MPNYADILGQQMAGQAAGGILGMMFGGINDQRQLRQQEDLQRLQIQGQKEMTDYGYKKQLQMWMDTNYQAQVQQLKKAGLNPALLYGMGGAGGATTGGGAGNVTGGQAPQGGGEIMQMAGMGIGTPLIMAQIEKTKAETENIKADTVNKPIQGKNVQADTENKLTQNEILEIENHIKGRTQNMAIAIIQTELQQKTEEFQIKANEKKISNETLQQQIDTVKAELAGIYIRNELTEIQKQATKMGIQVNQAQISTWATQLTQAQQNLNRQEAELQVKKFEADLKAQYPGLFNVIGERVNKALRNLDEKLGNRGPSKQTIQ